MSLARPGSTLQQKRLHCEAGVWREKRVETAQLVLTADNRHTDGMGDGGFCSVQWIRKALMICCAYTIHVSIVGSDDERRDSDICAAVSVRMLETTIQYTSLTWETPGKGIRLSGYIEECCGIGGPVYCSRD